jgi:hypothetical protein
MPRRVPAIFALRQFDIAQACPTLNPGDRRAIPSPAALFRNSCLGCMPRNSTRLRREGGREIQNLAFLGQNPDKPRKRRKPDSPTYPNGDLESIMRLKHKTPRYAKASSANCRGLWRLRRFWRILSSILALSTHCSSAADRGWPRPLLLYNQRNKARPT